MAGCAGRISGDALEATTAVALDAAAAAVRDPLMRIESWVGAG
jgi:hypothetical protein